MTISAKVIAYSVYVDKELITFELEYPRFIHSEFMTHRVFSRNGASSRAIPIQTQIQYIQTNTAGPVEWGKNKPGMQADEPIENDKEAEKLWISARDAAIVHANQLSQLGVHKQLTNRVLEPFSHMKVVLTTTELDNWFELRDHKDAQPEIQELARTMKIAKEQYVKTPLSVGDWHLPYYQNGHWNNTSPDTLDDAIAISASCCAQVSYRKLDDGLSKAKNIYDKLLTSKPMHASPFEHQATPMEANEYNWLTIPGVTHIDKFGNVWSNNFKGWVQYRALL